MVEENPGNARQREIYLDGAAGVGFGRPYVYGLAVGGANGVEEVCRNFVADLDLTLLLQKREI
jgi:isopentenyl-diphosphate delta-isomerase